MIKSSCQDWKADKALKAADQFFRAALGIKNVKICVIVDAAELEDLSDDADGLHFCENGTHKVFISHKLALPKMIRTLAHEYVHVKQVEKGEIFDIESGIVSFCGKEYKEKEINYHDLPWEKEAWGKQGELARNFWADYLNLPQN